MKKRILACLLALVMIIGILPVMALAEDAAITPTENWYDASKTALEISSAADLLAFAKEANDNNNTFEGKKITLKADIDLGDMTWTPIKSFKGEFDGSGKTIRNFKLDTTIVSYQRAGFFNGLETGSKVHDLTLEHVEGTVGAGRIGTLANYINGEAENVTVRDINVTTTDASAWVGGLCAFAGENDNTESFKINNCTVENLVVNAEQGAALIGGFNAILSNRNRNEKTVHYREVKNCNVNGFKVVVTGQGTECDIGGFAMQTQIGWCQMRLENCHVSGIDITATGDNVYIGGFILSTGAHTRATNCTSEGKIDATGVTSGFVGGFLGSLGWNYSLVDHGEYDHYKGHVITKCSADVDIIADTILAGGFVASATNSKNQNMYAAFDDCTVSGSVTSENGIAGGFAGIADRGAYTGCKVSSAVSGATAGGFIGKISDIDFSENSKSSDLTHYGHYADEIRISDCSVAGRVFGTERVCGLIGEIGEKDVQDDAANGHVIVSGSSVAATLVRATEDVPVYEDLYKVDNNKPLDYIRGTCTSKIVTPETGVTLTRDEKNEIEIPVGTEIRDSGVETPTQLTGRVLPDGSIVFDNEPGAGDGFLSGIIAVIGSNQPFTDVAGGAYYNEAVRWAVRNGIASGTDAKHFSPDAACTRGQTVTFLWRAAGCPAPTLAENPFTDVKPSDYCYDAVLWAVQTGVAKGTSASTFSPDAACTRGQIVTFLYRAAGSPSGYANSGYVDVPETSYCAAPVAWAVALRVTSGTSAITFSPDARCTRAQIVTFLYRANA